MTATVLAMPERPIENVIGAFQRWLELPDPGIVSVTLGAVVANLLPGDPIWLLNVGAPGSGKTETLHSLIGLPNIHAVGTLTESSLLSGTPKREKAAGSKGGLLPMIGEFGILLCKDFGSVLNMNRDARAMLLAALREIYDGAWTRHVGSDGGRTLHWAGKVGMLGGCTPVIDGHHAVMSSMGERFLLYRLPEAERPERQALRALEHASRALQMRAEIAGTVRGLFASIDLQQSLPKPITARAIRLATLATLAAHARSSIERDGRTREIELVPEAEMPARLAVALNQLDAGMFIIGVPEAERWRLVCKIALDCMPTLRRKLFLILNSQFRLSTLVAAATLDMPTSTVRRGLEDLVAHHVVVRIKGKSSKGDEWELSTETLERLRVIGIPDEVLHPRQRRVPEMSEED